MAHGNSKILESAANSAADLIENTEVRLDRDGWAYAGFGVQGCAGAVLIVSERHLGLVGEVARMLKAIDAREG
jgi:hypothetical protein